MRLSDFLQGVGQPFPYYPSLARLIGMHESVFLCRLIWWTGLEKKGDGWIYKTQADLEAETGMTRREQETARKSLRNKGLLEEQHERLKHRMNYRVNTERLNELWEAADFTESPNAPLGEAQNGHPTEGQTSHSTKGTKETQNRQTEDPDGQPSAPKPEPSAEAQRKQRHQQFIAEWVAAYENDRGQTYRVTGRDAKAVKTLATEGHDPEELIWTARQAWKHNGPKHWNCQRAVTIYFFAEHLNEIRAELRGTAANRPATAEADRKF